MGTRWQNEQGMMGFEVALTALLLLGIVLAAWTVLDIGRVRVLTQRVAVALGPQAMYDTKTDTGRHWDEVRRRGYAMLDENLGRPAAACLTQCDQVCGDCSGRGQASCINFREEGAPIIKLLNSSVKITVTQYVEVPLIAQSQIFPEPLECVSVVATYYVNKWNNSILFNLSH